MACLTAVTAPEQTQEQGSMILEQALLAESCKPQAHMAPSCQFVTSDFG